MTQKRGTGRQGDSREDRLRAALRANLGRRKAQARARIGQDRNRTDEADEAGPDTGMTNTGKPDTGRTEGNE